MQLRIKNKIEINYVLHILKPTDIQREFLNLVVDRISCIALSSSKSLGLNNHENLNV